MNADELRALQAPFKDRYRSDPTSATLTLQASARVGAQDLTSVVEGGPVAGLHRAAGGDGQAACAGDMLLQALVACAGVTLAAVATALGIALRGGSIRAEGDLDFRGTLGVSKEVPVGFRAIRLSFDLDTDASPEQFETLVKLSKRYCVVYQTLANPPPIDTVPHVSR